MSCGWRVAAVARGLWRLFPPKREPLYAAHARDERREEEPGQQYARAARALEPRLLGLLCMYSLLRGLRACTLYYLPLLGWTTLL